MITCVLSLTTACGSEETVSEYQQSKIAQVESMAPTVIEIMQVVVDSGTSAEVLANYNNIELGDWFAYNYSQYTGTSFECEGKGVRSAITSFESSLEKVGSITELGTPSSVVDGDTIIVTVPVTGENGNGLVELIFSNDIYFNMSACTFNLEESFGELMARAALNTLIGMGTVFAVLILISVIIACFGFIPKIQAMFAKKADKVEATPAVEAVPVAEEEELADDTELVAVIAAAIAAYEGTSADGFRVRSIKRANTKKWQRG